MYLAGNQRLCDVPKATGARFNLRMLRNIFRLQVAIISQKIKRMSGQNWHSFQNCKSKTAGIK
jgi:hypothetical protein